MSEGRMRNGLVVTALAGVLALGAGCTIVGSRSDVSVTGRQIPAEAFGSIVPQESTEEDVLDLLGPPTRTLDAENGIIYVYEYEERRSSSGHLLLIFSGSSSRVERETTYLLIRDGVVVRTWTDGKV